MHGHLKCFGGFGDAFARCFRVRRWIKSIQKLSWSRGCCGLSTYYVGQAVGLMNKEKSVKTIVYEFMEDYVEAIERLSNTLK